MQLATGTFLQGGKYQIQGVLGQGGFGITYLAYQPMLDRMVCIKEFFFRDFCDRGIHSTHVTIGTSSNRDMVERFKTKFIKEARIISRLQHPNIISIFDIFEENSTAYYVMEYVEGESLEDMTHRLGCISEVWALNAIKAAGSALEYIHSMNLNHLDIKPANIMCRHSDGRILVIDFGVSKQYDADTSEGTTTTPVGISKGYSPLEQYSMNGVQSFSPQSDVYSLAATLFKLLTGMTPPEATIINDEGLPIEYLHSHNVSVHVIAAISNAMKGRRIRTQSINEFLSALFMPATTMSIHTRQQIKTKSSRQYSSHKSGANRKKTYIIAAVASLFVLLLSGGGTYLAMSSESGNGAEAKDTIDIAHSVDIIPADTLDFENETANSTPPTTANKEVQKSKKLKPDNPSTKIINEETMSIRRVEEKDELSDKISGD